jgi:GMP synthase-like glutamine amidotransferase
MSAIMVRGLAIALALGICVSAQVLSPVAGGSASKELRQVRIVTLSRHGFEPPQIGVRKGKLTIVVRDLTRSS